MEINFETESMSAYREILHQIKRTQVSMESVVPDTQDDVGRILFVQPTLFLKEKTVTERGVYISGEAAVSILYIHEMENAVSSLQFSQSFTLEYDQAELPSDVYTQIVLTPVQTEARILNPRKLSVALEVTGELTGYHKAELQTGVIPGEDSSVRVYTKSERLNAAMINAVCEKSFVLNEQFPFLSGKAQPTAILSNKISFLITGHQLVGSKVLVKGKICIYVCYLAENTPCPQTEDFSAAFSQLVDIGQEKMDGCAVRIEPTSAWFSLIDSINGEKTLDAEIHALMQITSRCLCPVTYLEDAYCNKMPTELIRKTLCYDTEAEPGRFILNAESAIEIPEDCEDVLQIFPQLGSAALTPNKVSANVTVDFLYRTESGTLSCIHRIFNLEDPNASGNARLLEVKLAEPYFRTDGRQMNVRITVELLAEYRREQELSIVSGLILDEENPNNDSDLPTLVAVRVEEETIWELARTYHSSPEKICLLNDIEGDLRGKYLLVPKCE